MTKIILYERPHANEVYDKEIIGMFISYLYRYGQIYLGKKLEPYGIGSGQFPFLMRLFHEDGINQRNLSNYLQMDKATATRAIKKLVDEGYIFRQKDKEDKRSYRIFLSEKGKRLEPYMKKIASEWNDILLSSFDDNQKKEIMNSLEIMFENVSKHNNVE